MILLSVKIEKNKNIIDTKPIEDNTNRVTLKINYDFLSRK